MKWMRIKDIVYARILTAETQIRRRMAGKAFTQSLSDISRVLVWERTGNLNVKTKPEMESTTRNNISLSEKRSWRGSNAFVVTRVWTNRILPCGILVSKFWINSYFLLKLSSNEFLYATFVIMSPWVSPKKLSNILIKDLPK